MALFGGRWLFVFFVMLTYIVCILAFDPYKILGVAKSSSTKQIKTAYKKLVKEWHPDKSSDPKAEARFIEITKAYSVLSDSRKKSKYDRYGTVDDSDENRNEAHDFGFFSDFGFDSFRSTTQKYAKHRISYRTYHGSVFGKSNYQPFIFLVYSDFCIPCAQIEPVWERVTVDLDAVGYGIAAVNNFYDHRLVGELGVSRLPSFVFLVEGTIYQYKGQIGSVSQIVKFAKSVIPVRYVQRIATYDRLKKFLEDWQDTNKVSVLMLSDKPAPRLRYLLAAMRYREYARFAYVQMIGDKETEQLRSALGIRRAGETMLIFNETPENGPVATLASSGEISADSIKNVVENNKYLTVPRISSQQRFDDICPASGSERGPKAGGQLRLCCLLLVDDPHRDLYHIEAYRRFVAAKHFPIDRVRFALIYRNSQKAFLDSLTAETTDRKRRNTAGGDTNTADQSNQESEAGKHDVVVVWRTDHRRAKFEWLSGIWDGRHEANANKSGHELANKVEQFLRGKAVLSGNAILQELIDENGPGWFTRLTRSSAQLWNSIVQTLSQEEVLPMVSALGTLLLILALGYGLSYAANAELRNSEQLQQQRRRRRQQQQPDSSSPTDDLSDNGKTAQKRVLTYGNLIHELRSETYFGLVRLLKPGCRSFILIVDEHSKEVLLKQFFKIIWPWRNNKTLSFGYLVVPKNIAWFRSLLQHTLSPADQESPPTEGQQTAIDQQKRLNNINPKQTVGTVLAINGWRLYFSIYHPMHAPSMIGCRKKALKRGDGTSTAPSTSKRRPPSDDDRTSSTDSEEELITKEEVQAYQKKQRGFKVEDVLSGLPNFLDRLFEGSCRRYHIPEWPENMK